MPRTLKTLLLLAMLPGAAAQAQVGRSVPDASYYATVRALYDGQYARCAKGFEREWRTSVRIGDLRWVDAICFHAMRGESLYQMGDNLGALREFDNACELMLANSTWMMRVSFQQNPRPDRNPRRVAPFGTPMRAAVYSELPETMLISFGQIDNSAVAQTGGRVSTAQFWKLDVVEVIRCTALAIRRRNQLLGPLGQHDKLSRELANRLSRGGIAQANHWSESWADLLAGLAHLGVNKPKEAAPHLARALFLEGKYDHRLTGAAFLAQAHLAMATGEDKLVPRLTTEAALAAYAYEDLDVLCEALALGHVHQMATGGKPAGGLLAGASAWANRERADHVSALLSLLQAEQFAVDQNAAKATALLAAAIPARSNVATGRLAPYADYLASMVAYQKGQTDEGDSYVDAALTKYRQVSLSNFQLALSNERFDAGQLAPRIAVEVYPLLLTDPSAAHWLLDPIDAMTILSSNHEAAYDRWIASQLNRREVLGALYTTDLAKRSRFFRNLPLGGRRSAVRTLLEEPGDNLTAAQRLERATLEALAPNYRPLAEQAQGVHRELADSKSLFSEETARRDGERLKALTDLTAVRELLIDQIAMRRVPTTLAFPPRRAAEEVRQLMAEGDALMVFHQSGDAMHGFLLAAQGEHYWRLPDAPQLAGMVGNLLKAMGNYSSTKSLDARELADEAWRTESQKLADALFKDSRFDIKQTKRLVIVPDGPLWHLPFEALPPGEPDDRQLIVDAASVRYVPTMGLAYGDRAPMRPVRHTGVALANEGRTDEEREMQEITWRRLKGGLEEPVRLPSSNAAPATISASVLDALVVLSDGEVDPRAPYRLAPLASGRSRGADSLADWIELPQEGPQRILLGGLTTAAENGLKGASRRSTRRGQAAVVGQELFHVSCGLLASGGRTVLMSRWRTGGAVHRNLVQEMAGNWTHEPAADAWRRSRSLARAALLDPDQEPRYRQRSADEEPPSADHPFFWAGYLLVDTGYQAPEAAEE